MVEFRYLPLYLENFEFSMWPPTIHEYVEGHYLQSHKLVGSTWVTCITDPSTPDVEQVSTDLNRAKRDLLDSLARFQSAIMPKLHILFRQLDACPADAAIRMHMLEHPDAYL